MHFWADTSVDLCAVSVCLVTANRYKTFSQIDFPLSSSGYAWSKNELLIYVAPLSEWAAGNSRGASCRGSYDFLWEVACLGKVEKLRLLLIV